MANQFVFVERNGIDWTHRNLENKIMSQMDLVDTDLRGSSMRYINLAETRLIRSNLHGNDMSWATLVDADCSNANLMEACLFGINGIDAVFDCAIMIDTDWRESNLHGAKIRYTDCRYADCRGVDFSETDCRGTSFKGARLTGALFAGAILDQVDMRGVDTSGVNLSEAEILNLR